MNQLQIEICEALVRDSYPAIINYCNFRFTFPSVTVGHWQTRLCAAGGGKIRSLSAPGYQKMGV